MISVMMEPRHERAKVDLVQINIAHGAATPPGSVRAGGGSGRTEPVTSMIVSKADCGAEDV